MRSRAWIRSGRGAALAGALGVGVLFAPSSALADPSPPDPDPWFGPDKALHFGAGAVLAGGGYGLGALATEDIGGRVAVGITLALTATLAKEMLDAAGLGTPSYRDAVWGVVGTAVGVGISITIDVAVRSSRSR